MYVQKAILLDAAAMERSLMRISHEIVERNEGRDGLCVVGVYRRGAVLAEKIARNVEKITGLKPRLLIDRGHRELPIRADYTGKNVPTSKRELIEVRVEQYDGVQEGALLEKREEEAKHGAAGFPAALSVGRRGCVSKGNRKPPYPLRFCLTNRRYDDSICGINL